MFSACSLARIVFTIFLRLIFHWYEDSKKDGKRLNLNNKFISKKILLTENEVEEFYGINKRTLQRERVYNTGIPYVKIGRRVRYKRSIIDQYIQDNTVGDYQYD